MTDLAFTPDHLTALNGFLASHDDESEGSIEDLIADYLAHAEDPSLGEEGLLGALDRLANTLVDDTLLFLEECGAFPDDVDHVAGILWAGLGRRLALGMSARGFEYRVAITPEVGTPARAQAVERILAQEATTREVTSLVADVYSSPDPRAFHAALLALDDAGETMCQGLGDGRWHDCVTVQQLAVAVLARDPALRVDRRTSLYRNCRQAISAGAFERSSGR